MNLMASLRTEAATFIRRHSDAPPEKEIIADHLMALYGDQLLRESQNVIRTYVNEAIEQAVKRFAKADEQQLILAGFVRPEIITVRTASGSIAYKAVEHVTREDVYSHGRILRANAEASTEKADRWDEYMALLEEGWRAVPTMTLLECEQWIRDHRRGAAA